MAMRKLWMVCGKCGAKQTVSRDAIAEIGGRSSDGTLKVYNCRTCGNMLVDIGTKEIYKKGKD